MMAAGAAGLQACGSNGSNFTGSGSTTGHGSTSCGGLCTSNSTSTATGDGGSTSLFPTGHCDPTTNVCTCPNGTTSSVSIKGKVYDPAGVNPVYNASVYAINPTDTLFDLDAIPIACGCSQLFPSTVNAYATTDGTGSFQMACPPTGMQSIVVQVGKWRMRYDGINVTNGVNTLPSLRLPRSSSEGSLPNIAISTGGADSLECLPFRMGVSASEYTGGGQAIDRQHHIHVFQGSGGAAVAGGSPASYGALWDSQADLNIHDVNLLSCEGHETYGGAGGTALTNAQRAMLNAYGSAGGRAFLSHFHYAWLFQGYFNTAPALLGTWNPGVNALDDTRSFPAAINTTLSNGAAFPEGAQLQAWMQTVGAEAAGSTTFPVWYARHNVLSLNQPPATEWMHIAPNSSTDPNGVQYFSADLPIPSTPETICGRLVYSDIHVSGGPGKTEPPNCNAGSAGCVAADYPGMNNQGGTVPDQCAQHKLTAQEDALEFMLLDLSSCLIPPGSTIPPPPTQPR
jgi:hypothetical protein